MQLTLYRRDNRKRNARRARRTLILLGGVAMLSILGFAAYRWHAPLTAAAAAAPTLRAPEPWPCQYVVEAIRKRTYPGSIPVSGAICGAR